MDVTYCRSVTVCLLWVCGCDLLWVCGCDLLWVCGCVITVGLWLCDFGGSVAVTYCGSVAVWLLWVSGCVITVGLWL